MWYGTGPGLVEVTVDPVEEILSIYGYTLPGPGGQGSEQQANELFISCKIRTEELDFLCSSLRREWTELIVRTGGAGG